MAESAEALLHRQSHEARLEALKERCNRLRKENIEMKHHQEKTEKDTHDFVAYFQKEIEKKDEQLTKLTEKLYKQEKQFKEENADIKNRLETELSETRKKAEETEKDLENKLHKAQDDLTVLSEFKHEKTVLEAALKEAEQRLVEEKDKHHIAMNAVERKYLEEKARIQKDIERRIEEIKTHSRIEAQKGLDADTIKIIADNRQMGEELHFQLQTSDELQKNNKELKEENKRLLCEVSLANEKGKEYANQGYRRERELKESKQKIKTLERSMSKLVREFEHERQSIVQKCKADVAEMELETSGLRQLVKLKNKELKNVRQLAQVILDQRTEVEQYFLEALEQVKVEIRKQREEKYRQNMEEYRKQMRLAHSNPGTKFPAIKAPHQLYPGADGSASILTSAQHDKVDLKDLSWEDRERVLRLLFAKINAVQNQSDDVMSNSVNKASDIDHDTEWQKYDNPHPPIFQGNQPPSLLTLSKPDIA